MKNWLSKLKVNMRLYIKYLSTNLYYKMKKIIHFQFNLCTKLRNSFQSIVLELSLSTA
jgi:hypothetical protein